VVNKIVGGTIIQNCIKKQIKKSCLKSNYPYNDSYSCLNWGLSLPLLIFHFADVSCNYSASLVSALTLVIGIGIGIGVEKNRKAKSCVALPSTFDTDTDPDTDPGKQVLGCLYPIKY